MQVATQPKQLTPAQRLEAAFRRSKKFSGARVKNKYFLKQVYQMLKEDEADMPADANFKFVGGQAFHLETGEEMTTQGSYFLLSKYKDRLETCARLSLYRTLNKGRQSTLITGLTCNHRLCNICNMIRSRKLRRKWRAFLQDDTKDIVIRKRQAHMFGLDAASYSDKNAPEFTSGKEIMQKFDMMHLTLTMPHTGGRWNDREYYAQELLKLFHQMRQNSSWWLSTVFGGEYTIETTLGKNGLHVHLHALILTDKTVEQSRNMLYKEILLAWNRLTINYSDQRPARITDAERIEGIIATHKAWQKDREQFVTEILPRLDARGATSIGLKSLYHEVTAAQYAKLGSTWQDAATGKYYHYCKSGNPESMTKGVIECLKYHFEPCALEMPDQRNVLNTQLLRKVLPNIYKQRLYGKFGGFYGVSQLNVMEEPITLSDLAQDLQETAQEVFCPATGGGIEPTDYHYRIADAQHIAFDKEKKHALISRKKTKMIIRPEQAATTRQAVQILGEMGIPKKRD